MYIEIDGDVKTRETSHTNGFYRHNPNLLCSFNHFRV